MSHSCNCNGNHHDGKEKKWEKLEKILYIISVIIFAITFIPQIPENIKIGMYIVSIILAGYEILFEGIKNIFKLNFEEDTLMAIAVVAACVIGEFTEGALVILLFKLGEFIEHHAVEKSNDSIKQIADIKAKNANLLKENDVEVVDVNVLKVGDTILIKPGEMVPVDCKVISGKSEIDTSNINGESIPVVVSEDMELLSGTINLNGSLKCIVQKEFKDSTAAQIVDLVYEAQNNKGKTEKFITKFSKIYTPIVIVLAILIAVVPPIIGLEFKEWFMRALVFLVASCPCSIVISIPLALYTGLGAISKKGMLIKGTKHIEDLSKAKVIAFDKTGTLTTGKMEINELNVHGNYEEKDVLEYIYLLEKNSAHPIASAINKKIEDENLKNVIIEKEVKEYKEIAGCGLCGNIDGKIVLFGNKKLLEQNDIKFDDLKEGKNYLSVNGEVIGDISLKEEIRENTQELMRKLNKVGIEKIVILTGDNLKNAKIVAEKLNVTDLYAGLLPQEKLEKINLLKKQGKTLFVGDGINDSPVLAASDFGISMGEGTEIASNTADSILISNNLEAIPESINIGKKTVRIMKENIIFSLAMKLVVLTAGVLGVAPVWLAVFADVGVTIITVINAIRIK